MGADQHAAELAARAAAGFDPTQSRQRSSDSGPPPEAVRRLVAGAEIEQVWRNEIGGRCFRCDDRFVKWSPVASGIDLERERTRLVWLAGRHSVPLVLDSGADAEGQWLVTAALAGEDAAADRWRANPEVAVRAIADGLRSLHAVPVDDVPGAWSDESWVGKEPAELGSRPPIEAPVLVHGDACAPNTVLDDNGAWLGHVDVGDMAVGDRWADLAIAAMSLDWNFGAGHEDLFFSRYGTEIDEARMRYHRALWHLES